MTLFLSDSFLSSGVAKSVGAVSGFLILLSFLSPEILYFSLGFVVEIMVYIPTAELHPIAHQYGHGHTVSIGVILGKFVMAVTLLFL